MSKRAYTGWEFEAEQFCPYEKRTGNFLVLFVPLK
jgi:hypothetical protein